MGSPENNSKYETKESLNTNPLLESLKNEVNISVNEQKLFYITQVLEARKDELKYSKNASSLSFVDAPGKALRVQYIEQTLNELKNINSE
ncbi:hypothetical protein HOG21_03955 [bacterium]|jgi:hypothetical protein|nr:hypothetical protein [bacterium]